MPGMGKKEDFREEGALELDVGFRRVTVLDQEREGWRREHSTQREGGGKPEKARDR